MRHLAAAICAGALLFCVGAGAASMPKPACTAAGPGKRCVYRVKNFTAVLLMDGARAPPNDAASIDIDDPDTSVAPADFLLFVGLVMAWNAPELSADRRGAALKQILLAGTEQPPRAIRLGNYDWLAQWKGKHLALHIARAR